MYRKKDFLLMEVYNEKDKRIGFIKDMIIQLEEEKILGFVIISYNLFKGYSHILKEDIISFKENMRVRKESKGEEIHFNSIKSKHVIDEEENILGFIEDIVFTEDFKVNGVIISTGYISNFLYGKKVVLPKDLIVSEENIIYKNRKDKINFVNLPNNIIKKENIDG
ncbi:PRC-barrel domain-containing protein [Clostridium tetani]|uniref:PRC-barrel domain-containing protein n=1 Tax=Clostridium tetani TaxID=1513 RepID=UPI00100A6E3D|nr:PRC-barrel domain-containing protein [Clostridium tetani]RXM72672.1 photosystem reaction center subunit H [Clostridium tetani]